MRISHGRNHRHTHLVIRNAMTAWYINIVSVKQIQIQRLLCRHNIAHTVKDGKLGFLIINKWTGAQDDASLVFSVLLPPMHIASCISSLSAFANRVHMTTGKQMDTTPRDSLTFKSRLVSGSAMGLNLEADWKVNEKQKKQQKAIVSPGAHEKDNEPRAPLVEKLYLSSCAPNYDKCQIILEKKRKNDLIKRNISSQLNNKVICWLI